MNAHLIIPDRTGTRKARVPMTELIRLINECRQSGMTDAGWCRENDIAVSAFYHWVSRCRKTSAADPVVKGAVGKRQRIRSRKRITVILRFPA